MKMISYSWRGDSGDTSAHFSQQAAVFWCHTGVSTITIWPRLSLPGLLWLVVRPAAVPWLVVDSAGPICMPSGVHVWRTGCELTNRTR